MRCDRCDTPNIIHARREDCATWPRCPRCGGATRADASDTSGSWKPIRLELGLCDVCAIREERAREYAAGKSPKTLIINGYTYSADPANSVPLGAPDPHRGQQWRGMAGRRFDIQRLDGSAPFSCYSLWGGGEVDEWVRDRMPDNARFLNGAERAHVGEITCFNPSRAPASVDTVPQGGDSATGSVRSNGSAVPAEQGDAQPTDFTHQPSEEERR